ncbi:Type 1 glutamine amidotransferase (GATase1) [Cyclobacterium lianum]|uniref:Type 1 glutamine amidotransferase (GATase1) n=1 Tax=Cyclobacterium lianum TaxID=388280 RepID=A0A1M7P1J0_9BACT|nr:ThuA domain-containing protein [Cyclobacterium lianum]SHN10387.1 Type 1 glutamine amidotransferase (GATase1) [Cyclobacterium lianum]
MKKVIYTLVIICLSCSTFAQSMKDFPVSEEWLEKIESLAPADTRVDAPLRKVLVFSQHTGFYHWIIPHNNEMLKILAKKTGAFDITISRDIDSFDAKHLKQYDAIILNNSNPSGPDRDLFADLLRQNSSLGEAKIAELSAMYEENLMEYVAKGGGLMIMHGAITVQNNSEKFSAMVGGSFDYHPRQQEMHLKEVDPSHPLVQAFDGKGFTHVDEPYFFKNAYFDYNFRPLLYIEADKIEGKRKEVDNNTIYVAWIKKHGKGRVFYSSPSHNAQSMDQPELLQFFLDGLQYVAGDLKADDSTMEGIKPE